MDQARRRDASGIAAADKAVPTAAQALDVARTTTGSAATGTASIAAAATAADAAGFPQPHPLSQTSDYSPNSNPWAERPPYRTSAGVAVRFSASDLPTPGAFTPMSGMGGSYTPQSVMQAQHAASPAMSDGASNMLDTPVSHAASPGEASMPSMHADAWDTPGSVEGAGSSTKPRVAPSQYQQQPYRPQQQQQQQQQRFAASPGSWLTGAPAASPSEVTPTGSRGPSYPSPSALMSGGSNFGAASSKQPAAGPSAGAAAPAPAAGPAAAASATTGPSEQAGSEASRERFSASPTDLLRKAASKMRAQAAVCECGTECILINLALGLALGSASCPCP